MEQIAKLIDVVSEAWRRCLPAPYGDGEFSSAKDGQTDCNRFVQQCLGGFGYHKLDGFTANGIAATLPKSPDFLAVSGKVAAYHAARGAIVVAAWENKAGPHGHVCIVLPGALVSSGKWKDDDVPKVANVSTPDLCRFSLGANYAFGEEPTYHVLTSSIVEGGAS